MEMFRKQGGMKLIKDYWSAGVLGYACCQLVVSGPSRKSLELLRLGVEMKVFKKIYKRYYSSLERFDTSYSESSLPKTHSNKVWVSWMQGMENAPALVQRCYRSLQENLKDREIILITSENLRDYTDMPSWIMEKYEKGLITHTHFSDLLRLELLCKHGGTWIDSTVFCSGGDIPSYMLDSDLFMFQNLKPGADGSTLNISSWFMTACANNKILLAVRELLWEYWKKEDRLIDYFLVHHFIVLAYNYYSEEWSKMVQFPNSIPHIIQLMQFEMFNKEKWIAVTSVCPFHKLTYKVEEKDEEKTGTYYDYILNS